MRLKLIDLGLFLLHQSSLGAEEVLEVGGYFRLRIKRLRRPRLLNLQPSLQILDFLILILHQPILIRSPARQLLLNLFNFILEPLVLIDELTDILLYLRS